MAIGSSFEEIEAKIANDLANSVSVFRQSLFEAAPRLRYEQWLPRTAFSQFDELREVTNVLLLELRVAGVGLLLGAALIAAAVGLVLGDRSGAAPGRAGTPAGGFLRTELSPEEAAAWDVGGSAGLDEQRRAAPSALWEDEPASQQGGQGEGISAARWLQLLACVGLDAAGDLSLFYPIGELADVGFAALIALAINAAFEWPSLAVLAFVEELLPLTDVLPTATIGWLLVVSGSRAAFLRSRGLAPSKKREAVAGAPRPQREAYAPPEPWLREGSRPWE